MPSVRVKALYVTVPRTPTSGVRTASAGQIVSVSDEVAGRWVRLGAAEHVNAGSESAPGPVLIEVDGEAVDLSAIEDADKLRDIAVKAGLEIPGNVKKVETLRDRIAEHMNAGDGNE